MKKFRRMLTLLIEIETFYAIPQLSTNFLDGNFISLLVGVSDSSPRSFDAKDLDIKLTPTIG